VAAAAAAASAVAGLDQLLKASVRASVAPGEKINVFFAVDLTNVRNTGVAFGALRGTPEELVLAITLGALAALLLFFALRRRTPLLWLPVGLVVGGAVGNLIDRLRLGAVTDFIDPWFWPAFNLADAAVVVGIFALLYVAEDRPEGATGGHEADEPGPAPEASEPAWTAGGQGGSAAGQGPPAGSAARARS
jgi:signal peptidase II